MIYIDDTGAISATQQDGFLPVYQDEKPTATSSQVVVKGELIKHEDHYQQTWQVVPASRYTAGEWLESHGLGTSEQPALIFAKMQLAAAGKTSAKLSALEVYMMGILAEFAATNQPRNDWPVPPYTYSETITEVVTVLSE